jgi:hypothetical protein
VIEWTLQHNQVAMNRAAKIIVDGKVETTWEEFVAQNKSFTHNQERMSQAEFASVVEALRDGHVYHGGGAPVTCGTCMVLSLLSPCNRIEKMDLDCALRACPGT